MATPKALVLRAAGTNCDRETQYALQQAGFAADRLHIFRLMENPTVLRDYQFLLFAGGFSYGDDIASGKIYANQLLYRLAEPLNEFVQAGKCVLGICNGFQVMIKSGLLPWAKVDTAQAHRDATLAWNDNGRYTDRWVYLRSDSDKCVFIPKGKVIALPMAHGEGKFVPANKEILRKLQSQDQIAVRYCDAAGKTGAYPVNPNGSIDDIAGICDPSGRVMGLMPHPERFVEITHHPRWTREKIERADGRIFFDGAFEFLSKA